MKFRVIAFVVLFVLAVVPLAFGSPIFSGFIYSQGTLTTFDYPGSDWTSPLAISDNGQMVGYYYDTSSRQSFLYSGGTFSRFEYPSSWYYWASTLTGINDKGQIVGNYESGANNDHSQGFLDDGGVFQTLQYPGATRTSASGISGDGKIVGTYVILGQNSAHGFIYDGGVYVTFDYPGATNTVLTGINDLGQVIGSYDGGTGGSSGNFFFDGSAFHKIAFPGADDTSLSGLNDSGQIVGTYSLHSGWNSGNGGFLYDGGSFQPIEVLGRPTAATGINDAGQIVGGYLSYQTPIPEPATLLLLSTALAGLAFAARRKLRT